MQQVEKAYQIKDNTAGYSDFLALVVAVVIECRVLTM
jgi:hypothetical protein